MDNKEIERKYLVDGDFRQEVYKSMHIVQGYLCAAPRRTVRVRICDDKAWLTIKGARRTGELARFEWEKEILVEDAYQLLELAETGLIDKTRHLVHNTDGVHVWEIDEFHGVHEGLVVAEIELQSETDTFDKPSWLGKDVTDDHHYANSWLAGVDGTC